MRILLTRPREDAERLAAKLAALGHNVVIEPLIAIAPIDAVELPLDGVQALLFTSANGVRAFARASDRRDLRVMAVGDATANAALAAGFARVESAGGDVEDLARLVRQRLSTADGPLLHVAATDVAGDLKTELEQAEFSVRRIALYRAEPVAQLSEAAVSALRAGEIDVAVVFSPRTAQTFVKLVREADIADACTKVVLVGLSSNVTEAAAGLNWKARVAAGRPDEPSIIAAIERLDPRRQPEAPAPQPAAPAPEPVAPVPPPRSPWPVALAASALIVALAALYVATRPFDLAAVNGRLDSHDRRLGEIGGQAQGAEQRAGAATQGQQQLAAALAPLQQGQASLTEANRQMTAAVTQAQQEQASLAEAQRRTAAALAQAQQQQASSAEAHRQLAAALAQAQQQNEQRAAALAQAVQVLERRLTALEAQPRPEALNLDPLRAEAQRLSREVSGLVERSTVQARVAALAQLRDAVDRGAPFATELATARRLFGPAAGEALTPLAAHGERGIATREALAARFATLVQDITRAPQRRGEAPWERAVDNLTGLVRVRPVGEVAGPAPEAVVARAERRLRAGDLAAAVDELGQLSGAAAQAAAPWRNEALARLSAERILSGLAAGTMSGAAQ
jgi:uroporphyrinogen-III synthase